MSSSKSNIVAFRPSASDPLGALAEWHSEEIEDTIAELLRGVPPEGGTASRVTLQSMIRSAFLGGVIAQHNTPAKLRL